MLNDILQEQKRTGTSPAKGLTDDQIRNIINVRNELGAASTAGQKGERQRQRRLPAIQSGG